MHVIPTKARNHHHFKTSAPRRLPLCSPSIIARLPKVKAELVRNREENHHRIWRIEITGSYCALLAGTRIQRDTEGANVGPIQMKSERRMRKHQIDQNFTLVGYGEIIISTDTRSCTLSHFLNAHCGVLGFFAFVDRDTRIQWID